MIAVSIPAPARIVHVPRLKAVPAALSPPHPSNHCRVHPSNANCLRAAASQIRHSGTKAFILLQITAAVVAAGISSGMDASNAGTSAGSSAAGQREDDQQRIVITEKSSRENRTAGALHRVVQLQAGRSRRTRMIPVAVVQLLHGSCGLPTILIGANPRPGPNWRVASDLFHSGIAGRCWRNAWRSRMLSASSTACSTRARNSAGGAVRAIASMASGASRALRAMRAMR
jgi:hypothetical protein